MRAVAMASPPAIPAPVLVARETTCPLSVTTVTVEVAVADSRDRMMAIGITQISRKKVVSRSSFSG